MLLRSFSVFNAEQVTGPAVEKIQKLDNAQITLTQECPEVEELIRAAGARITHGGDHAYYVRPKPEGAWPRHQDGDFIVLPHRKIFESTAAYYSTALHEMAHWSEVRLGWNHRQQGYAQGELIAEITSAYLAAELGIPLTDVTNTAAYLRSWLQGMAESSMFIFQACSQATKTTDYLLSFVRTVATEVAEGDEPDAAA